MWLVKCQPEGHSAPGRATQTSKGLLISYCGRCRELPQDRQACGFVHGNLVCPRVSPSHPVEGSGELIPRL